MRMICWLQKNYERNYLFLDTVEYRLVIYLQILYSIINPFLNRNTNVLRMIVCHFQLIILEQDDVEW